MIDLLIQQLILVALIVEQELFLIDCLSSFWINCIMLLRSFELCYLIILIAVYYSVFSKFSVFKFQRYKWKALKSDFLHCLTIWGVKLHLKPARLVAFSCCSF